MKQERDTSLIKPLEKGDLIYNDLGMSNFIWYRYLCPLPLKNGKDCDSYHILIDARLEQPVRMYYEELNRILKKNLNNLEEVRLRQVELTEKHLEYLKTKEY